MLLGGWGERALALLEAGRGASLERVGELGVVAAEGAGEGRWRCWMVGRLTNFEELDRGLTLPGPNGGATLAAATYERAGPAAIDLLRGSFALVAVDGERGRASVARDHLGGRPLVFVRVGDGLLFAEHEHQLLELLPRAPGPDRLALWHWLERGGIPPGRTLYEGIERLPPAHRLLLSRDGIALERYWSPRYAGTLPGPREEIAARLREEAFAAIDRAAGRERVAVRLSGGLDSACVAAGLAARGGGDSLAEGAVFPGQPETDEQDLISATARHTGLALEEVRFEPGSPVLGPALRHLERWRLPSGSPNLFVWEAVAARARERGVAAMLDGEGGDELFGLAPYLIADALGRGRLGLAWTLAGAIPGVGERPEARLRLRALRVFGIGGLVPDPARRWRRRRAASRAAGSLLSDRALLALADLDPAPAAAGLDGPRWWRSLAADLTVGGEAFDVSGQLRRQAVAGGVDARHPFLFDRELAEAVLASPPRLQFDPVRDRALLRDALRGQIPERIRCRHAKSHFTPLLVAALAGAEGERAATALADPAAPVRAYLREGSLDSLLARRGPGMSPAAALRTWRVIAADAWLRSLDG